MEGSSSFQVVLKAFSSFYLNKCGAASLPLLIKPLLPLLSFFSFFWLRFSPFGFTEMSLSFQLFKSTCQGGLITFLRSNKQICIIYIFLLCCTTAFDYLISIFRQSSKGINLKKKKPFLTLNLPNFSKDSDCLLRFLM